MNKLEQALVVMVAGLAMSPLVGCDQKRAKGQWEYKVVHFDREEHEAMETSLGKLGDEGWEYAGPLANNGLNAQFVAFKRLK
jgi:hypothetical protein